MKETEIVTTPRYVVDANRNRVEVVIKIEEYRKLLDAMEELASLRAYDAAEALGDEAIPCEQAISEIEGRAGNLSR